MPHWLSDWIQNQKRTRRFHPSWILLAAVVVLVVAGIIWILATLVTKAEAEQRDRQPAAESPAPDETAVPAEEVPATPGGQRHRGRALSLPQQINIGIV